MSEFFNPVQIFQKLKGKSLDLMKRYLAKEIAEQLSQREAKRSVEENLNEAIAYIQVGQYESGQKLLITGVFRFDPHNHVALFAMGFALIELGEFKRGLEHFEKVFESSNANDLGNPTYFSHALQAYAAGLLKCGYYDKAILACTKLHQIYPHETDIWSIQAESHKSLNQYSEAKSCYQKALQFKPNDSSLKKGLEECYTLLQPTKSPFSFSSASSLNFQRFPVSSAIFMPLHTSQQPRSATLNTVSRSPQRPPKVEDKYSKEVAGDTTRNSQRPPEVEDKHRKEFI